ncbi:hypothetical protein [Phnomibacter ginsenosidimutans]|uniref:Uncharacterized protein n=1 Tax=Phnomibacter ginsenosidimutans TaxID=2676868 RepID=A0A6I6GYE1_9BACT|nr:hypothetical protein [Phnomibacter ginsenosidimutans]QGW27531.1 hypothetical protein GLV81_04935 [Phnomibacter ginsenosidimutans]
MHSFSSLPDWYLHESQVDAQSLNRYVSELYAPRFSVSQMGVSRQELLYWRQKGILDNPDFPSEIGKQKSWVKVNVFDFCWIQVVVALRKLNAPLETIAALKSEVTRQTEMIFTDAFVSRIITEATNQAASINPHVLQHFEKAINEKLDEVLSQLKSTLSIFNLLVLNMLSNKKPYSLLVQPNGSFFVLDVLNGPESTMVDAYVDFIQNPFISIPLLPITKVFINNAGIKKADVKWLFNLTDAEVTLLELLQKEDIQEVRVRLNNRRKGEILIETIKQLDPAAFEKK